MTILDRAKAAAESVPGQANQASEAGRARDQMRERRQFGRLLQQLGAVSYAERSGEGGREAVVRALAALDAHRQAHLPGTQGPGRTAAVRRARDARNLPEHPR